MSIMSFLQKTLLEQTGCFIFELILHIIRSVANRDQHKDIDNGLNLKARLL